MWCAVSDAPSPVPFTQQLLDQANSYRQQARDLRAQPNLLANPPPNLEAERLDALATELVTQAIATDASNESARVKANLEKWVGDHKAIADWHNENTKSLISMSQTAIRLQVTINAGAAVALLAFLGNAINKNAGTVAGLFSGALAVFPAGVTVAALVGIASYATQFLYAQESPKGQWWARVLHGITFTAGFVSLGFFVAGCVQTYDGMRSMAKLLTAGTAQHALSPGPSAPNISPLQEAEVPDMGKLPPTGSRIANDNAPQPFKNPPPQAQIPPPAPRSPPPTPSGKK